MTLRLEDLVSQFPKLSPISGIADAFADGQKLRQQREQLQLEKDKFSFARDQLIQQKKLQEMQEKGEQARAVLLDEKAKREAQAELTKARQTRVAEFAKLSAERKDEAARAMIPELTSMGVGVDLEDVIDGKPRYRIDLDPKATAARATKQQAEATGANQRAIVHNATRPGFGDDYKAVDEMAAAGIGYNGTELDDEPELLSTQAAEGYADDPRPLDERYQSTMGLSSETEIDPSVREAVGLPQALSPTAALEEPLPRQARAPDQADLLSGVPKDVIDIPAQVASTMQGLDPVFAGLRGAYPDEPMSQDSVKATEAAVRGMGLPATASIEAFDKLRGGPDQMINNIRSAEAAEGRFKAESERRASERVENRQELSVVDQEKFKEIGSEKVRKSAKDKGVTLAVNRRPRLEFVIDVMGDPDPNNKKMLGNTIARMNDNSGASTKADFETALGKDAQSFLGQIMSGAYEAAFGGLNPTQIQSIIKVMRKRVASDDEILFAFQDDIEGQASASSTNEYKAMGMRDQLPLLLPRATREAWQKRRDAAKSKTTAGGKTAAASPPAAATPAGGGRGSVNPPTVEGTTASLDKDGPPGVLGKFDLPKQSGEVENAIGSWLGDMKHPAIKVLAQNFTYDSAGGSVDEAVGEYVAKLEADYPEAWAAAKRGDNEGFQRALTAKPSKPDPNADAPPKARSAEDQKVLDEIERLRRQ